MELKHGLYERIVDTELDRALATLEHDAELETLTADQAARLLAAHVHERVLAALRSAPDSASARLEITNNVLAGLDSKEPVLDPATVLRRIGKALLPGEQVERPILPLGAPDLLVNAQGQPNLLRALTSELPSADHVDVLVSFLKWRGVQRLQQQLSDAIDRGVRIRVLTTTYMGASDARAAELLAELGAEIRVSYDTNRTRLHAKAWLLGRDSGYSTAFVGSSNISVQALSEGLEWNVRLAEAHTPEMVSKIRVLMNSYWESAEFVDYEPLRFAAALAANRMTSGPTPSTGAAPGMPSASQFTTDPPSAQLQLVAAPPPDEWDLAPYTANPYQLEMLESLESERLRHDRWQNLVVAATGVGKTVVAALDYWRLHELDESLPRAPRLLFVAHRKEILEASRATFRRAGDDPAFGELLVGGDRPSSWSHVFGSIQSLSAMDIASIPPDQFDVLIVDEFHHSEAATYTALLNHLKPRVLLGLTATPERTDGQSVLHWFGGRMATEYRLWDALEDELLAPFHYYGINDETDLSRVGWRAGGYVASELDNVFTGDVIRARRIIRDTRRIVEDVQQMRAIAFCVSVAHADFMSEQFNNAGIKAVALTGKTELSSREAALDDLETGDVQVVCAVDILNEGVDLPNVDTLLFLRPTESATVFLQQLGRGLRHAPGKSELTVLDFVGRQHQQFRFDLRYRALTGASRAELKEQIEEGFPHLPPGVHIELDRQVTERILSSIQAQIAPGVRGLDRELRSLTTGGRRPGLSEFLTSTGFELEDLHAGTASGWTWLQRRCDLGLPTSTPGETDIAKRIGAIIHADDRERLSVWKQVLTDEDWWEAASPRQHRIAQMLLAALFGEVDASTDPVAQLAALWRQPALVSELLETLPILDERSRYRQRPFAPDSPVPLHIHAHYTRREIMAAYGFLEKTWREGVRYHRPTNTDLFAYTLDKSKGQYSPTTMYADAAISPTLIQWESQSATAQTSATGKRYLDRSSTVLMFQRPDNNAAYLFLGEATLESASGNRPIRCNYRLATPMPEEVFHAVRVAG